VIGNELDHDPGLPWGFGFQFPYTSHTYRKTCGNPHGIPIPTEPRNPTRPMGSHHSPHRAHTHSIPIPMGIPMGISIPTAALP